MNSAYHICMIQIYAWSKLIKSTQTCRAPLVTPSPRKEIPFVGVSVWAAPTICTQKGYVHRGIRKSSYDCLWLRLPVVDQGHEASESVCSITDKTFCHRLMGVKGIEILPGGECMLRQTRKERIWVDGISCNKWIKIPSNQRRASPRGFTGKYLARLLK